MVLFCPVTYRVPMLCLNAMECNKYAGFEPQGVVNREAV